jgi:hypothetical protein
MAEIEMVRLVLEMMVMLEVVEKSGKLLIETIK